MIPTEDEEYSRATQMLCPHLYFFIVDGENRVTTPRGNVGAGWKKIIRDLSITLERVIQKQYLDGKDVDIQAIMAGQTKITWPTVIQIKEKFGSLRFYLSGMYDGEMEKFISEASKRSAQTCEYCGEPGEVKGDHWLLKCVCKKHTELNIWV
jgi:hypothetical protein